MSSGGIIRSNSQLNHAEYLSFDAFNHAIYPGGDWVTKLTEFLSYKKDEHLSGTNHTLASISKFIEYYKSEKKYKKLKLNATGAKFERQK